MNDMSAMNRENKKKQLKKQIVKSGADSGRRSREESSEEIVRKAHLKVRRRRFAIFFVILLIAAAVGFGAFQYLRYHQYSEYEISWDMQLSDGNFVEYVNFEDNFLKYTKDGVSCIDKEGKVLWVQSYEMVNPIATVSGGYAAIADQQGNSIYICNKNGCQGVATTLLPVLRVAVSAQGVTAAILEDSKSNYIQLYQKDGTALDITIKCLLGGEIGYPLDITLSPDGTQLMASFVYINNGKVMGRAAFYNFSEVGKNVPTRLVGGFDEDYFSSSIIPRVRFFSEVYSCAFADDSLAFFSSKNLASPQLVIQHPVDKEIRSVFYSDQYAGIIVDNTEGENPYRMDIYEMDGDPVFSKEFNYPYKYADIDGDNVLLYNEDSCRVYNMAGVEKFSGQFDWTITKVRSGRFPNTLILIGPDTMKEIKLK